VQCRKTQSLIYLLPLAALLVVGCASSQSTSGATGPNESVQLTEQRWGSSGTVLKTAHFTLYTTMNDPDFNQRLAQVMEGALTQYRRLAPTAKIDPRPMDCYIFANRRQWAEFTRQRTGNDAAIYLQINRGGYTVGDFFVAYYIGESGTLAVAAHEGWHQFVARHFKDRLPPFLEEGIATTFENISWDSNLPRWNMLRNVSRSQKLRDAIEKNSLWSLPQLVSMHAGDVVGEPAEKIEAFYAQNWAFARFLTDGAGGRYRAALNRMLADAVAGTLAHSIGAPNRIDGSFNPRAVRPMLEHYLGTTLEEVDSAYQAYIRELAKNAVDEHAQD